MKKLLLVAMSGLLMSSSLSGFAREEMKCGHRMMSMKYMDTDNDGTISKEEFMKSHETMWEEMKKNKDGTVDVKGMRTMHKKHEK